MIHSEEFKELDLDELCIISGDFNDWRSLLRALFVEGLLFQCATDQKQSSGRSKAIRTFPSFAPQGGLDRLYYRGKGLDLIAAKRCNYKVSKIASDHLAIIIDFEIQHDLAKPESTPFEI